MQQPVSQYIVPIKKKEKAEKTADSPKEGTQYKPIIDLIAKPDAADGKTPPAVYGPMPTNATYGKVNEAKPSPPTALVVPTQPIVPSAGTQAHLETTQGSAENNQYEPLNITSTLPPPDVDKTQSFVAPPSTEPKDKRSQTKPKAKPWQLKFWKKNTEPQASHPQPAEKKSTETLLISDRDLQSRQHPVSNSAAAGPTKSSTRRTIQLSSESTAAMTNEEKDRLVEHLLEDWRILQASNQQSAKIIALICIAAGGLIAAFDLSLWLTNFYGVK